MKYQYQQNQNKGEALITKWRYYPSQQSNKIMRMTSPLQYRHTHPVPQQYGGKLPTYNNIIILVHHRLGSETHHPNHIMKFLGLVTLLIVFLDLSTLVVRARPQPGFSDGSMQYQHVTQYKGQYLQKDNFRNYIEHKQM